MTHSQSVNVWALSDAQVRASTSGGVLYVQVMTLIFVMVNPFYINLWQQNTKATK